MSNKVGGSQFKVFLVDGYDLLAHKPEQVSYKKSIGMQKSTGLGDEWEETVPTGVMTGAVTQSGGFFDTAANAIHDAFKAAALTARLLCFAPAGNDIGGLFVGFEGVYLASYEPAPAVSGLTKATATYATTGQIDEGQIIQSHTTKTGDWNTKTDGDSVDYALDPSQTVIPITSNSAASPTVVTTPVPHGLATGQIILISGVADSDADINGEQEVTVTGTYTFTVPVDATTNAGTGGSFVKCNSLNGGVGYQMVSDLSGFSGFVGTISDSADDTTFAELIAFTDVTAAPAKERVSVSGTVDRYLCFVGDVTGSGSVKPFVGFKRNA